MLFSACDLRARPTDDRGLQNGSSDRPHLCPRGVRGRGRIRDQVVDREPASRRRLPQRIREFRSRGELQRR